MAESPLGIDERELTVLRAGVRLMALRAFGDTDTAEEVAQETIVRAFHALRSSRPEKLGPFVAGIARHVIADIIRARPREGRIDEIAPDAEPRTQRDPLVVLCDAAEQARVREALCLLAPEDRELLHLLYFDGLSPSEIAERLGAPPERIRQRKLRALLRLRVAFDRTPETTVARHADSPDPTMENTTVATLDTTRRSE